MLTVEALLEERRGYVVRGLANRVAEVDEQIKALGFAVADDDIETTEVRRGPGRPRKP